MFIALDFKKRNRCKLTPTTFLPTSNNNLWVGIRLVYIAEWRKNRAINILGLVPQYFKFFVVMLKGNLLLNNSAIITKDSADCCESVKASAD